MSGTLSPVSFCLLCITCTRVFVSGFWCGYHGPCSLRVTSCQHNLKVGNSIWFNSNEQTLLIRDNVVVDCHLMMVKWYALCALYNSSSASDYQDSLTAIYRVWFSENRQPVLADNSAVAAPEHNTRVSLPPAWRARCRWQGADDILLGRTF